MKSLLLSTLAAMAAGSAVAAADIRLDPNPVYLFDAAADRHLVDAVLHNVLIVNDGAETVTLTSLSYELIANGNPTSAAYRSAEQIASRAQRMAALNEAGMLNLLDFQFHLSTLLGTGEALSPDALLEPGEALLEISVYLASTGTPDHVRITAIGETATGQPWQESAEFPVSCYQSATRYRAPVDGRWFVFASGDAHQHHRWVQSSEYALDIVRLGENAMTYSGDGQAFSDFHAYGQPVLAAADGVVVAVADGIAAAPATLQRSDESPDDYAERSGEFQQNLVFDGGIIAASGNHIIIRHADGEYSVYGHLQPGRMSVAPGQQVSAGQPIAAVGGSGNSTEPHLHFQLIDGPDLNTARGLPVEFEGLRNEWGETRGRHLRAGHILEQE